MQRKDLLKQLKTLKSEVRPHQEWKASTRELLLNQINAQTQRVTTRERFSSFSSVFQSSQMVLRPLFVLVMVVGVGILSYTASVSATKNSLPGDLFYPVKLTSERVQVNFAQNREEKASLEISFARRRLEELKKIKEVQGDTDITIPLQKFQESMTQAQTHLEQIKLENVDSAIKLANSLSDETDEFVTILEEEDDAPQAKSEETKTEIKEAIIRTKTTGNAALAVLIESTKTIIPQTEDVESIETAEESEAGVVEEGEDAPEDVTSVQEDPADDVEASESSEVREKIKEKIASRLNKASAALTALDDKFENIRQKIKESDELSLSAIEEGVEEGAEEADDSFSAITVEMEKATTLLSEAREYLEAEDVAGAFERLSAADLVLVEIDSLVEAIISEEAATDEQGASDSEEVKTEEEVLGENTEIEDEQAEEPEEIQEEVRHSERGVGSEE